MTLAFITLPVIGQIAFAQIYLCSSYIQLPFIVSAESGDRPA